MMTPKSVRVCEISLKRLEYAYAAKPPMAVKPSVWQWLLNRFGNYGSENAVMNGAEAAATIRKTLPDTRIVIFTLFSDALGKVIAKLSGVDVVVSKTEGIGGLAKALHKLFAASLS